ncbi:MAG: gliding motility-associated-like protein [Flavobacteriales bacterium]|jgi:gliding motility-associated-like protein
MRLNLDFRHLLAGALLITTALQASAQCDLDTIPNNTLYVDNEMSPTQMAQELVGEGVDIFNVSVTAHPLSYGYYCLKDDVLGESQGILLSTGHAENAVGPNDESGLPDIDEDGNCLNCDEYDNFFAGSPLLTLANGGLTTWDACVFEFDVITQGDSLKFDFMFASEEYLEWVGSSFNDVFGFFITADNIGTDVNIALIPNTTTPVAINTVNHIDNSEYFYDNQDPLGLTAQYDGFTQGLRAEVGNLIPCDTIHLKLIIADGSDRIYDSGVFISRIESNPISLLTSTAGGIDDMIEGCNDGTVTFQSQYPQGSDLDVLFSVSGDANFPDDYNTTPDLATLDNGDGTYTITIPSGSASVDLDINTIFDGILEGQEFVTISLLEQTCDTVIFNSEVNLGIIDSLSVTLTALPEEICPGNCTTLTGDAIAVGDATFTWDPIDGLDPDAFTQVACPDTTTTYTLTSNLSFCQESASITVIVTPLLLDIDVTPINCEGSSTGDIDLTILNGQAPFTITWEDSDGNFISNSEDLNDVAEGTYCVTVEDDLGCLLEDQCVDVLVVNPLAISEVTFADFACADISCPGACDGLVNITVIGGSGVYTFEWTGPDFTAISEDVADLCEGTYTVVITDDAGCVIAESWTLDAPTPLAIQLDGVVDVLCSGESTGQACVTSTGGCPPYFYSWSHDDNLTSPCALSLASDTFYVQVADLNGCLSSDSLTVVVGEPIEPLTVLIDNVFIYPGGFNVSCPNAADGAIDITVSGGIPNYVIQWNNLDTPYGSFIEDPTNVPCGSNELTVTDDNNCIYTEIVELTCVPDLFLEFTTVQNPCGAPNGSQGEIHLTNYGGGNGAAHTVTWISGPSCGVCVGDDLTGLDSGNYIVELEDSEGCAEQYVINIGQNLDFTITEIVMDATCFGTCDGSIDVTVVPAIGTEVYSWVGPDFIADTSSISELCAGTYNLTIVQGDCEQEFTFDIGQLPEIEVEVVSFVEPSCIGQNDGSIQIAVSGGTGILTVDWPAIPECSGWAGAGDVYTLSNLVACDYIVNVTDGTGCVVADTISLVAPQVMIIDLQVSLVDGLFNISCNGAQDGSISASVSGGTPDCVTYAPDCYEYDWSACDDVIQYGNDVNSTFVTDLGAGTYCVNVTDINGCLATSTIDMTEPDPIESSGNISDYNGCNISCFGANDGWIVPEITGGSSDFESFEWISGGLTIDPFAVDTILDLGPGDYCLYVIDSNDCEDTVCWTITEPALIEISIDNIQQVTCYDYSDGSISVSAIGGCGVLSYNWVDLDANVYVGNVLTGLPAGTYTLTVSDTNGCSGQAIVTLDEPELFEVDLDAPVQGEETEFILQCNADTTGSINATIIGGEAEFGYSWADCDDNFITNDVTLTGLGAGCYCLTVTDATGCEAISCMDITEPDEALIVTSDLSLYPGDFNISCAGAGDGFIDLTTTGGVPDYTYIWHVDGDTTLFSIDEDLNDLSAGFYDVLITDQNGCDTTLFLELIQPPIILVPADILTYDGGFNVSCYGECDGEITISPAGGVGPLDITWASPLISTSTTVSNLCTDTYSVSIIDSIGCEIITQFVISEPDSLQFNEIITPIFCFGDSNGAIDANISGGSGNYTTIEWTPDVSATEEAIALSSGEYCLSIEDSNGCLASACWEIDEPVELTLDVTPTDANCGACDGFIDVTAAGGTGVLTYTWTGADVVDGDEDQQDLCPGDYTVTVTDENLCSLSETINIDGPDPIEANPSVTQPLCFGDCDGEIVLDIVNAADPFDVVWTEDGDKVGTGLTLDEICEGSFTASVLDVNGCSNSFDYVIIQPDSMTINGISPFYNNGYNVYEFEGNDGSLSTDVFGGTPGYTLVWDGPTSIGDDETESDGLTAGSYLLTVTDVNGCEKDTIIVLTQPDDLTLPTGLTPNGDGLNDFYVILGVAEHPNNTFIVFNRWGNIVYEKAGYNNEWYGQGKDDQALPDGTYYVIFEADDRSFNTFVDLRR